MITLDDVAQKAGVSASTVSRVLNNTGRVSDKVREHVKNVIEAMGYQPNSNARALASKRTEVVGLVTPNISLSFNSVLASGVSELVQQRNYKMLVTNSYNDKRNEINAINSFRAQGLENILVHSHALSDRELVALATDIKGLVVINRFIKKIAHRCVWLDNVEAGKVAAEYCLNRGHTKIAMMMHKHQSNDDKRRIEGITLALNEKGLSVNPDAILYGKGGEDLGRKLAKQLIESELEYTTVIAYNDLIAAGALNEFQDQGIRVPEDVSIIGFDNLFICTLTRPSLTTIHHPICEMAKYAANLSINLVDAETETNKDTHLFLPTLVERDSVYAIQ